MRVISSSVLRASAYEMHGPGPPRPVRECPARGREPAHRRWFLPTSAASRSAEELHVGGMWFQPSAEAGLGSILIATRHYRAGLLSAALWG